MLAATAWPASGALILFDGSRVNGAVFCLHLACVVHRDALLQAAGLDPALPFEVYLRDLPWPLPPGLRVDVSDGDAVVLVPAPHGLFVTTSLADQLASANGWNPDWAPTLVYTDNAWVLSVLEHFHFTVLPARRPHVREDIAARLGCPAPQLVLRPARPAIFNHARRGIPSRNAIVALPTEDGGHHGRPRHAICFVDCRPLLLGVSWRSVPAGRLQQSRLRDPLVGRCPAGFLLCPLQDDIAIQDGEVITLFFLPSTSAAPVPEAARTDDSPTPDGDGARRPGPFPGRDRRSSPGYFAHWY